jgi:hypothetical protein
MADINTVNLYSITIPNQTGEGAKVLTALSEAGVNFCGLWGYPMPDGSAQLDVVPEDGAVFGRAARKLKLTVSAKKPAFYCNGKDKPGALAAVMAKLAAAGINVHAAQAVCSGGGKFGAFVQVADADVKAAKKALAK